ncbi:MAG TPA: sensor histidine kinase [Gaiella sp.]|jgi:signal transduction histidine kinase|nr:sensor histidine kinase [Gaiella sp.]
MSRLGGVARGWWFDAVIVVLAGAAVLEVAIRRDDRNAPETTLWFCIPAAAVVVLGLLARRRFPFGAPAAFWLLAAAFSFVDGRLIPYPAGLYLAGILAAFLLGNLRDPLLARVGLAVVLASMVTIIFNRPGHSPGELVYVPLLFGIAWLAGFALNARAEQADAAEARAAQAERERETAARIAVAEERTRIARELHDIVAHAVSVMVLQVGAVRHKLPDELGDESDALRGVEGAGRTALAEMRRLLAAMRDDGDDLELVPQPGLDSVGTLVADVERAGLPVTLHVEGEAAPLPRAVELSAYRIVQEALTNALKHAHANRADVTLRYGPDELRIEIRDDGTGGGGASNGQGYGLVGVRERVKIYGGTMTAGTAPDGGFVLDARLPLRGDGR